MGVIRGALVILVVALLVLSILSMNLLWTVTLSLKYENIQRQSSFIAENLIKENDGLLDYTNKLLPVIKIFCQNNSDYVFSFGDYVLNIPCDKISDRTDTLIEESVKDLIHNVYYHEYDCNFWNCLKTSEIPLFLISEKAYKYWNSKFILSLIISFILLISLFFFIHKKSNLPIILGVILILSSLPFIKLDSIISFFPDKTAFQFMRIFFSESYSVAITVLITGIIILILGIFLKIFKMSLGLSSFISKFIPKLREEFKSKKETKEKVQAPISRKLRKSKKKLR